MREHLYKGKRIDNGEWVEGNLFIPDEGYNAPTQICIGTDRVRITYNVDPETVCEYAGLTDKNGKRIFEGRIVMAKVGLRTYMGIVKYDEKCAGNNGRAKELRQPVEMCKASPSARVGRAQPKSN